MAIVIDNRNSSETITVGGELLTTADTFASTGITDNSTSTILTLDSSNNINLPDNTILKIGTGSDLQIYHDASHSRIYNNTGSLYIRSAATIQLESGSGEDMITASVNGAVTIFYDANPKLATTNTGIDVTGNVVADAINLNAGGDLYSVVDTSSIALSGGTGSNVGANIVLYGSTHATTANDLLIRRSGTKMALFDGATGDFAVANSAGTDKMVWDAAAEELTVPQLAVGTVASPTGLLDVGDGSGTYISSVSNTIGFGGNQNTDSFSGWINYRGYADGTTRYRDFSIGNGKQGLVAFFDGSAGNMGLGVTPEIDWSGTHTALQIGGFGSVYSTTTPAAGNDITIANNFRWDGTNSTYILANEEASYYQQIDGAHIFGVDSSTIHAADSNVGFTTALTIQNDADIIVNSGNLGVGEATTIKAKVHVDTGASGIGTLHVDVDDVLIESNGNAGLTIGTPNSSIGAIAFADPQSNGVGKLTYTHSSDRMDFYTGGSSRGFFNSTGLTVSGALSVTGDLTVTGSTTTVNTETINLADNNIVLNSNHTGAPTQDAGLTIERGSSADKTFIWDETVDKWTVGAETMIAATFEGALSGNATTATTATTAGKWTTSRTITLGTDLTGNVSIDGSANVTLNASVVNGSHTHTLANITDITATAAEVNYTSDVTSLIQAQLNGKSGSSHNHTLDGLSNTTITSNAAGEILKWNGSAWINNTPAEAGISASGHTHDTRYYTETETDAKYVPLAGGTMTGAINMGSQNISAINNATAVSFLSTNGYWVGGVQRMNGTGNLLNIGTISSGAITTSGAIHQGTGQSHYFRGVDNNWRIGSDIVTDSGGLITGAATQMIVGGSANTHGFQIFGHQTSTSPCFEVIPNSSVANSITNVRGSLYVANTKVIDASRNLTNVTGNISMFTNDSGYLTAEADTLSTVLARGATSTQSITSLDTNGTNLAGLSVGEAFANYDGWNTQLNVHGGPHSRLNVKTSTVRMGVYAHNSWHSISGSALNGHVGTYTNHGLGFLVNASPKMVINTSGQVGINQTSPTSQLHVGGIIAATGGNSTNWNTAYTVANAALPRAGGTMTGQINAQTIEFDGIVNSSAIGALIGRNHAYDTLELRGHGAELMIGSKHQELHINYRTCNNGAANNTPINWFWRAGSSTSFSNHSFGSVTATSLKVNTFSNNAGSLIFSAGNTTTGAARSLNLRISGSTGDPSVSDDANSTGITWGQRTDSQPYYIIYPNLENWSSSGNYSKLTLAWHTGIKIGAATQYGGTRFYNNSPDISGAAVILNVGVGNSNIGVVNNLTVGGQATGPAPTTTTSYANKAYVDTLAATKTPLNDIRSLGTTAFTNGANPNITTAQVMAEIEADGGFDSHSSVFKTSWNYAGNYNLTNAGDFTETAGSSWITWTDNSSDTTRGNITALAIAPNTGGSAGGVFIYNDQGSGYSPGWRQVWTNTTDGAGSGLDADLLDGQQGSYYASAHSHPYDNYSSWSFNASNTQAIGSGETVTINGSGATSVTNSGNTITVSSTDTNTTYTAGANLSLTGTTFANTAPNIVQTTVSGSSGSCTGNAATATTAANSTLAGGLAVGTGRNNTANQIVRTNAYGYCDFGWINTTSGGASGTPTRIYCSQDSYLRYYTPASLAPYLLNQGSTKNAHTHAYLPLAGGTMTGNITLGTNTIDGLAINVSATYNLGLGTGAVNSITTGDYNVGVGDNALYSNTTGGYNVAVGALTLYNNISGERNTAVGREALYFCTGASNTAFGYQAGGNITTGSSNIIIGYGVNAPSGTASNQLNIGGWITGAAGAITVPGSLTTAGFTSTGIDDNATSTAITIDSNEHVLPFTDGSQNLGAVGKSWNTIYADGIRMAVFGSASSPTYSWENDNNTGMYKHASPDRIGWSTGGFQRLELSSTDFITLVDVIPALNDTYELGSASLSWAKIFTHDLDIDGTAVGEITTDNDGSFNMNTTNNFTSTPTAAFTLTFTNITAGQSGYVLLVNNSNYTVSAASTTKVNNKFLTTVSSTGTYLISYFSNGTNVYCTTAGAMA